MISDTALREVTLADPITILAPLAAALAAAVVIYAPSHLGNDATFWRHVRGLLPHVDEDARENGFYTTYEIDVDEELAGRWFGSLEQLESTLRDRGLTPGPLAAHKTTNDGRREAGSWVFFGRDLSGWPKPIRVLYLWVVPHQLHITIFPVNGDGWIVTAHYEYSAYSPLFAYWHLKVKFYDEAEGVRRTTLLLDDAKSFIPTDRARDLAAKAETASNL